MAEEFQISRAGLMFVIHINIYPASLLRSTFPAKRNVLYRTKLGFFAEHIQADIKRSRAIEKCLKSKQERIRTKDTLRKEHRFRDI